jgi:hypothetical protein
VLRLHALSFGLEAIIDGEARFATSLEAIIDAWSFSLEAIIDGHLSFSGGLDCFTLGLPIYSAHGLPKWPRGRFGDC